MRTAPLVRTLTSALGIALLAPAALAATYRMPSDAGLVHKAAVIVRGQVADVAFVQEEGGGIFTDVTVSVERVLKGRVETSSIVVRQPGGTVGDRSEVYPGIGAFEPDERVLLMLTPIANGRFRVTDFALGNFTVLTKPDGTEVFRREGLHDAFMIGSDAMGGAGVDAASSRATRAADPSDRETDPDRETRGFERYIVATELGLSAPVDYVLPVEKLDASTRIAGFVFLVGSHPCTSNPPPCDKPARWTQFDSGTTITYRDNSTGDAGSNCQPDGCHTEVNTGMLMWNDVPGAQILLAYGGTDASIGSKCLNALSNQIQFNDPCSEIGNLQSCTGTLALGGFSSSTASGGQPPCPSMGNPAFDKITEAKIMINNGSGSCLNSCDYTDMIAHETGHTLGAGHSPTPSALMHATINSGQCGAPAADDEAFATCAYPQIELTCSLSASKTWAGPPPFNVTFSPNVAGGIPPYTYSYDFGDGGSSTTSNPSHSYGTAAAFDASLIVTDSQDQTCDDSLSVTIQPCLAPNVTTAVPKMLTNGQWKATISGIGFKKGVVVQVDSGSGFVDAPITRLKTGKKLVAKDVSTIWPAGIPVQVRVLNPASCPSNPITVQR